MHAHVLYALAENAVLSKFATPQRRSMQLCKRIEQAGPVAVKLAQLAATTPGLVTDRLLQRHLSDRMLERVSPQPLAELLPAHELAKLKMLLGGCEIEEAAIGSASIAQVHKARIGGGGRVVAVKLVRPQARHLIGRSFSAMRSVLALATHLMPDKAAMRHTELLLHDAHNMLRTELDMAAEHSHMAACFADAAKGPTTVDVPKPLGHCLEGKVLLMDYVHAVPLATALPELAAQERRQLAQLIAAWWLEGVVRHRRVHGDPHIGNWAIACATGRPTLFDYGSVVSFSQHELHAMLRLLEAMFAVLAGAPGRSFFQRRAAASGRQCGVHILDWEAFAEDAADIVGHLTNPGHIKLDGAAAARGRRVPVRLSGAALQLARSLMLVDGVCRSLDERFAWRIPLEGMLGDA